MTKAQLRTITGLIIAIAVLVVVILLTHSKGPSTLQLNLNLPDYQNLSVKLNSQPLAISQAQTTENLKKGFYTLNISKPNYKNFSTQFTISDGQTVLVNAVLMRLINTAVVSWSQISSANTLAPGATLVQATYFYQQTWAFLTITSNGEQGYAVVKYNDLSNQWQVVLGPGTYFTSAGVATLPTNVANFMNNNNYVAGG